MKPIKRFLHRVREAAEDIIICVAYRLLFKKQHERHLIELDEYERAFL